MQPLGGRPAQRFERRPDLLRRIGADHADGIAIQPRRARAGRSGIIEQYEGRGTVQHDDVPLPQAMGFRKAKARDGPVLKTATPLASSPRTRDGLAGLFHGPFVRISQGGRMDAETRSA